MATIATTTSRSMTLLINDIIGGGYGATSVTITEMSDGSLRFDVKSPNGDLRGFALDFLNETLLKGMTASSLDGTMTAQLWGDDSLTKAAANDVNFSGQVANATGGLDAIMTFGTEGASKDVIHDASFVLKSASGSMTLDTLAGAWIATRVTSLTTYDANGKVLTTGDSSKDAEQIGMNLFDAKDDALTVAEDATSTINVFANDSAAKGAIVTQWYLDGVALKGDTYTDLKTSTVFTFRSDGTITANAMDADILTAKDAIVFNFSYDAKAADGADSTSYVRDHANVIITITGLDNDNHAPELADVHVMVLEDDKTTFDLSTTARDQDKGDILTFALENVGPAIIRDADGNDTGIEMDLALTAGLISFSSDGKLIVDAGTGAFDFLSEGMTALIDVGIGVKDSAGAQAFTTDQVLIYGVNDVAQVSSTAVDTSEGKTATYDLNKSVFDADTGDVQAFSLYQPLTKASWMLVRADGTSFPVSPQYLQGIVTISGSDLAINGADARIAQLKGGETLIGNIFYSATDTAGSTVIGEARVTINGVDSVIADFAKPVTLETTENTDATRFDLFAGVRDSANTFSVTDLYLGDARIKLGEWITDQNTGLRFIMGADGTGNFDASRADGLSAAKGFLATLSYKAMATSLVDGSTRQETNILTLKAVGIDDVITNFANPLAMDVKEKAGMVEFDLFAGFRDTANIFTVTDVFFGSTRLPIDGAVSDPTTGLSFFIGKDGRGYFDANPDAVKAAGLPAGGSYIDMLSYSAKATSIVDGSTSFASNTLTLTVLAADPVINHAPTAETEVVTVLENNIFEGHLHFSDIDSLDTVQVTGIRALPPNPAPTDGGALPPPPAPAPTDGGALPPPPAPAPTDGGALPPPPAPAPTDGGALPPPPAPAPTDGGALPPPPAPAPTDGGALPPPPAPAPTDGGALPPPPVPTAATIGTPFALDQRGTIMVTIHSDGSYVVDASAADWLGAGQVFVEHKLYTVTDSHGAAAEALMSFNIVGIDDPTIAMDEQRMISAAVSTGGNLRAIDPDMSDALSVASINGKQPQWMDATAANASYWLQLFTGSMETGTPLSVTAASQPQFAIVDLKSGSQLVINTEGRYSYVFGDAFLKMTSGDFGHDSFTWQVANQDGVLSQTATVDFTVAGANDAPVAMDDIITMVGGRATGSIAGLMANDSDIDHGDAISFARINHYNITLQDLASMPDVTIDITTDAAGNEIITTGKAWSAFRLDNGGLLKVFSDGSFEFIAAVNADGTAIPDSFIYDIEDKAGTADWARVSFVDPAAVVVTDPLPGTTSGSQLAAPLSLPPPEPQTSTDIAFNQQVNNMLEPALAPV